MKNHKQLIAITCLFLLLTSLSYATDNENNEEKKADQATSAQTTSLDTTTTDTTTAKDKKAVENMPFIPQGHLIVLQNETLFFPCNTLKEYPIEDKTKKNMLSYLYEGFSGDAAHPIYLEIENGKLIEKEGKQHLSIKKIKQASNVEDKLDCRSIGFNPNFRAMGTEPFWHLVVLPTGLLLLDEQGQPTHYPYVEPKITTQKVSYHITQKNKALTVNFEKKTCMPDNNQPETAAKFAYTAEITIGKNTFKGCAIKGKEAEQVTPTDSKPKPEAETKS